MKLYEYNVSTQKEKTQKSAWFSTACKVKGRQKCFGSKTEEGPEKAYRLMKASQFRIARRQRGFQEGGLVFKTGASKDAGTHLRVVISKKVAKQAVRRNRMRRVLQEAAKKELERVKEGQDLVLIVLPGFELPEFEETRKRLHRLLEKAALL